MSVRACLPAEPISDAEIQEAVRSGEWAVTSIGADGLPLTIEPRANSAAEAARDRMRLRAVNL